MIFDCRDPFDEDDDNDGGDDKKAKKGKALVKIDVDLSLTAFANAERYFEHRKQSSHKQLRTLEAGEKVCLLDRFSLSFLFCPHQAIKSASKRTNELLKEVERVAVVTKARKIYW